MEPTLDSAKVKTPDGYEILLTRYKGGEKGPVMVVHGVSVRSGMFVIQTVDENFVQFLVSHGYDVWLLDWRASIRLPLRRFTLDEAAQNDFPAAVNFILEETRRDSLQAVVHCVGSIAFFMSLSSGLLPQVRCVACSQIALHMRVPSITRFKTGIHLAALLNATGMNEVSPIPDPTYPVFSALLGGFVNAIHHECDSTVCHRMTFMYGHMYPHDNVNLETHAHQQEEYGPCNITTLMHLEQIADRGYAAKFDWGSEINRQKYNGSPTPPSYAQDATHLKIPITLVSGELNQVFLPSSTETTYNWLRKENDPSLYTICVIPNFGHFDNFVGAHANRHSYPAFLEQLDKVPAP